MVIDIQVEAAEQSLVDALSSEQIKLICNWLSAEKHLREEEGCHMHVSESLRDMVDRLHGLAQVRQFSQAALR